MTAAPQLDPLSGSAEAGLRACLCEAVDGEFEIFELLGRGGMGAVYLAHEHALKRRVAIKVLLPGLLANRAAVVRFRQEARTAAALDHPNIIPIHAVREVGELVFMVMRYVEGETLESVLRSTGALPLVTVQSILHQVGRALGYAHRRGVVHRDVKPANILIDHDGWALLGDFGIAKAADGPALTVTGTTVGTPFYMSPEACSEVPVTPASDQYSLGVMAYEMLAGHPPFRGASVASAVKQHMFDVPPPLGVLLPGLPTTTADAVMRMLEKRPEGRWPNVEDAIERIVGAAPPEGNPSRTLLLDLMDRADRVPDRGADTAPLLARALAGRTRRWAVASGIALLALTGIGGAAFARMDPTPSPVTLMSPDSSPTDLRAAAAVATPLGPADTAASDPLRLERPRQERPVPATRGDRAPLPAAPEPAREGTLLLGTRGLSAVLYVNGEARGMISRLRAWPAPVGSVRLEIRAAGCQPWDSTVVVARREELRIGYRTPECQVEGGS